MQTFNWLRITSQWSELVSLKRVTIWYFSQKWGTWKHFLNKSIRIVMSSFWTILLCLIKHANHIFLFWKYSLVYFLSIWFVWSDYLCETHNFLNRGKLDNWTCLYVINFKILKYNNYQHFFFRQNIKSWDFELNQSEPLIFRQIEMSTSVLKSRKSLKLVR